MTPPPSSNSDKTTERVHLTQPIEGDDCLPLFSDSDETVDWSQPTGGDIGDQPILDPHVWEFISGTGSPGGGGDEPNQSVMPKPSIHAPSNGSGGALIGRRL